MSITRTLAVTLLAAAPLAACSKSPPPAPPSAPAPPAAPAPPSASKTFIGRHVDAALDEARKELHEGNISIGDDFNIKVNGRDLQTRDGKLPKAEITPRGDLLIEGKAIAVTPAQREQLLAYRGRILAIADAGMAIGGQGADLAGEALGGVVGAIFGGKDAEHAFERKMEAKGRQIEAEALKLCAQLPGLLSSQQALAASLPAFKPYARMTQDDIDDCGKDAKGKGVAITSG